MTIRRRINLLLERKMVAVDEQRFKITATGTEALGADAPKHQPWVDLTRISAGLAQDVHERTVVTDISHFEKSRTAALGAQRAQATALLKGTPALNRIRMTGLSLLTFVRPERARHRLRPATT
jgi:hypothetical protein